MLNRGGVPEMPESNVTQMLEGNHKHVYVILRSIYTGGNNHIFIQSKYETILKQLNSQL